LIVINERETGYRQVKPVYLTKQGNKPFSRHGPQGKWNLGLGRYTAPTVKKAYYLILVTIVCVSGSNSKEKSAQNY
jgi:hypothetical protein